MNDGDPALRTSWRRLTSDLNDRGLSVQADASLSDLTTLRVGGRAALVATVENTDDARRFLDLALTHELPWVCLGGGSNVLADDRGFAGLIMLVRTRQLSIQGDAVRAGAGWGFDALIAETLRRGLTGLEFASGIPGTLGGALVGNAGCYGREIGEFLVEATVLRADGRLEVLGPADLGLSYRDSLLKSRGDVVLDMVLALARGDAAGAAEVRDRHIADRRRKHPWDEPSAGSYFKNLPPSEPGGWRRPAGQLLEAVGAKSMRVGGASVFPRHANIIVNTGGASSGDVLVLADRMKRAVHERFGVDLQEEVRHLATPDASGDPVWN